MPLAMGYRALAILIVFLQLSFSSPVPARNKRHVDGMFTSEFSRARGSAAIRKIINSALAGKRDLENNFQMETPEVESHRNILAELHLNSLPDTRSEEISLNEKEVTEGQICSAILYLLNRPPYETQQVLNPQIYSFDSEDFREERSMGFSSEITGGSEEVENILVAGRIGG
ncbi:secretin [Bombina bombina]|uniref:secretin n=1 Tax=Bombina bombina TaxID=8345 RepID=UPI00235B0941|nr:secretin [Bombina bombina]